MTDCSRSFARARGGVLRLMCLVLLCGCAQTRVAEIPLPTTQAPAASPDAPTASPAASGRPVLLRIDAAREQQVIEGFGATINEWFDMVSREDLMGALRPRVIEAVHGQIGITMGQLELNPFENFDPVSGRTANDDDDPNHFNWPAFNFVRAEGQKRGNVDPAREYGFDNYTLHGGTNVRWADPWLGEIRRVDYRRYLDEMAENVVAPLVHWRARYGEVPRWHNLFNEPITGNGELAGASHRELTDLVKAVGARLEREGLGQVRLVVPSEETEEASLSAARAILADPQASRYVGAIGFHTYPYGSVYSEVGRILATSGAGRPDSGRIEVRRAIRDLARQHGLQVWMTEVSNGRANTLDSMRGRAIHIHDELRYAGVSSYWAMFQAWNTLSMRGTCDEDCLVNFNRARDTVTIGGTGRAIGHYARWVRRGARSVDSESDDPLVLVSAFRDDRAGRLVAVVINNDREARSMALSVAGRSAAGEVKGEQSSAAGYWRALDGVGPAADGRIALVLPGHSVTSLSMTLR
jgi:O-glycosyl hydrolase